MKLLLGGSGQLGSALRSLEPSYVSPTRQELDIGDLPQLESMLRVERPDSIINCAAYTDVDGAEENRGTAMLVNAHAVALMTAYAASHDIPFVTVSTDYVFDGTATRPYVESSAPSPINVYGESKLIGELAALRYHGSLIVRTSWLFSATHQSFVSAVLRGAARGPIRVVDDQFGSPTEAGALARKMTGLIAAGTTGIVHLGGSPATSRYSLARAALACAGMNETLVAACASDEYPVVAARPRWSVLASERIDIGTGDVGSWKQSLAVVAPVIRSNIERAGESPH